MITPKPEFVSSPTAKTSDPELPQTALNTSDEPLDIVVHLEPS